MPTNEPLKDQLDDLFSGVELPIHDAAPKDADAESAKKQAPQTSDETFAQLAQESDSTSPPHRAVAANTDDAAKLSREGTDVESIKERQEETLTRLQALQRQVTLLQQANFQLQKRAMHLEASTAVSRAAASILNPHELMQTTVNLIRSQFKFYHVSFFLLDERGEWAVVRASTGEVGQQMVAQPHRLTVGGESMVGWVCAHGQSRIALDVGADAIHFDNPLLPHTRSEITLPLRVGDRILGALDVQSTEESAFDNDDVRSLEAMADLVAIALENARLFTETRRGARHQQLSARITEQAQRATNITDILALTVKELGQTLDLAQATICLGTEAELVAAGNGHDQLQAQEE